MRKMAVIPLAFSLALLGACSKTPVAKTQAAAPAAPNPMAAFARPHPKPGLWRMTMSTDAGPGVKMSGQICIDEKTEDAAFNAAPRRSKSTDCDAPKFAANPVGGISFETVCRMGDRTVANRGVATGDFSSAYALDVTSTTDPPFPGNLGTVHTRMESRYLGPCQQGQSVGRLMGMKLAGVGRG
jgi:hypothetical protein